jgi:3-hydroxybutyrate dehydrogenase
LDTDAACNVTSLASNVAGNSCPITASQSRAAGRKTPERRRARYQPRGSDIMRLREKVAFVTGAASGIGKQIAHTFAREGAKVVIADLNAAAASSVAAELDASGERALGVAMDVCNESQVEAGMKSAIAAFGRIDILVSNAGIQIVAPLEELSYADWKRLLAVHLDGAFLTTRAALRQMYKQGSGSVIYMGSVHSKEASVLKAPYVAAKHGLIGLAKVVAKEGAKHGVRANVICPGFVRTALVDKQIPEQAQQLGISEQDVIKKVFLKDTVDGEFTTTQDVAEAALFFASFESNALTGQSLVVSHGWYMQ